MPRSVTIDHVDATTITIAPAGTQPGGYRLNVKYALEELDGTELYRKEITGYNVASNLTPLLPAALQTDVDNFILSVEGKLNAQEGL